MGLKTAIKNQFNHITEEDKENNEEENKDVILEETKEDKVVNANPLKSLQDLKFAKEKNENGIKMLSKLFDFI
jgi:hypothetical protein